MLLLKFSCGPDRPSWLIVGDFHIEDPGASGLLETRESWPSPQFRRPTHYRSKQDTNIVFERPKSGPE